VNSVIGTSGLVEWLAVDYIAVYLHHTTNVCANYATFLLFGLLRFSHTEMVRGAAVKILLEYKIFHNLKD